MAFDEELCVFIIDGNTYEDESFKERHTTEQEELF